MLCGVMLLYLVREREVQSVPSWLVHAVSQGSRGSGESMWVSPSSPGLFLDKHLWIENQRSLLVPLLKNVENRIQITFLNSSKSGNLRWEAHFLNASRLYCICWFVKGSLAQDAEAEKPFLCTVSVNVTIPDLWLWLCVSLPCCSQLNGCACSPPLCVPRVLTRFRVAGRVGTRWSQGRQRRARHDGQCLCLYPVQFECVHQTAHTHTLTQSWIRVVFVSVCVCVFFSLSSHYLFSIQEYEVREYVRSEMSQHCGESVMQLTLLIYNRRVPLPLVSTAYESQLQRNSLKVWYKRSCRELQQCHGSWSWPFFVLCFCFLPVHPSGPQRVEVSEPIDCSRGGLVARRAVVYHESHTIPHTAVESSVAYIFFWMLSSIFPN